MPHAFPQSEYSNLINIVRNGQAITVSLTGGIGCGKSTVLSLLAKSFPVIDSDKIVHKLYAQKDIKIKLNKLFGYSSRRKLGELAFQDALLRRRLERFLHPLVWKEIQKQTKSITAKDFQKVNYEPLIYPVVLIDVPLLFEAGWEDRFAWTFVVACNKQTQLNRLKKQGYSLTEAKQRMQAQFSQSEKIKLAKQHNHLGFSVIWNNGTQKQLTAKASKVTHFLKLWAVKM